MNEATNADATADTGHSATSPRAGATGDTSSLSGGAHVGAVRADVGAVTPIPAGIVKRMCAIMATVEAVKKSQKNHHGGYMFSSSDDIYAAVARKMGEVGLQVLSLEDEVEIKRVEKEGKTQQWLRAVYSFVWASADGDTWSDARNKRTVLVQITGPQTFQSAQSFVEKAYLRSTFKLPSGDMDLDAMPQADNDEDQAALIAPRKKKSSAAAKRDGDDVVWNELRGAISGADGPADLARIKTDNIAVWETMPPRWKEILDNEYDDKMSEFGVQDAAE